MHVVTVEFEIQPEAVPSFRVAMLRQASNSLSLETACRRFDVCFDPENVGRCFLYELYDDEEAFDAHLASAHFREFDAIVAPWIRSKLVKRWNLESPEGAPPG